ncbi:unnamed protein product [Closterium sp. Yama58-4]|nr:unnamed protein product [Closterium sp. Yama58-4]
MIRSSATRSSTFRARDRGTYVPPKRSYIGGAGLKKVRRKMEAALAPVAASWKRDSVTVLSDIITDRCGGPQANILLVNDSGAVFEQAVDCHMESKIGGYIASLLRPVIDKVGPGNAVAVCIDGDSNYASATKKIASTWPHIEHVPCATHVLDLLMEDVGKMGWAKGLVEKAGEMITFVRNRHFIPVSRLCEVRSGLAQMVLSDEWKVWGVGDRERKTAAEKFRAAVMDEEWWGVAAFLSWSCHQGHTGHGLHGEGDDGQAVEGIFRNDVECTRVFKEYIERHYDNVTFRRGKVGAPRRASLVLQEALLAYIDMEGSFGRPSVITAREAVKKGGMSMVQWWSWHNNEYPELATLACRVLTRPVSASPCERGWAQWKGVHTARRNRLGSAKCADLIYIAHNWNVVRNWYNNVGGSNILDAPIPPGHNMDEMLGAEGEDAVLTDDHLLLSLFLLVLFLLTPFLLLRSHPFLLSPFSLNPSFSPSSSHPFLLSLFPFPFFLLSLFLLYLFLLFLLLLSLVLLSLFCLSILLSFLSLFHFPVALFPLSLVLFNLSLPTCFCNEGLEMDKGEALHS